MVLDVVVLVKSPSPEGSCLNPICSRKNRPASQRQREQCASTAGLFHTRALLWVTDSHQALIWLSALTEVHRKSSVLKSSMKRAGWVVKQAHIFMAGGLRDILGR